MTEEAVERQIYYGGIRKSALTLEGLAGIFHDESGSDGSRSEGVVGPGSYIRNDVNLRHKSCSFAGFSEHPYSPFSDVKDGWE